MCPNNSPSPINLAQFAYKSEPILDSTMNSNGYNTNMVPTQMNGTNNNTVIQNPTTTPPKKEKSKKNVDNTTKKKKTR